MKTGRWILLGALAVAVAATSLAVLDTGARLLPPSREGQGAQSSPAPDKKLREQLRQDTYSSLCDAKKFDGRCYYDAVWKAFDELELNLGDAKRRAEFAKWRHRFDNTNDLDCPQATASNGFACPSADRAVQLMINSIKEEFDYFFDIDKTKVVREQEHSTLEGVGVSVSLNNLQTILETLPKGTTEKEVRAALKVGPGHELVVMADPSADSPSAGIVRKGDVLVAVKEFGASGDALSFEGLTLDEAVSHLRGNKDTQVEITIDRTEQGATVRSTHTLKRAHIDRHVVHVREIEGKAIVLKIDDFEADTYPKDFRAAHLQLAQSKLPIVVDLRDNPGGTIGYGQMLIRALVEHGVELETIERQLGSDVFLRERILLDQQMALSLVQRSDTGSVSTTRGARAALAIDPGRPVGVLINGGSASTSEIVSGALKFNRRALLFGTPAVGKDAGQQPVYLPYGRRAQIPVLVFLPGGVPLEKLVPDREIPITADDIKQGRDPQLDALVEALQQESRGTAEQAERAKRLAEDRAQNRARSICIRGKAAELPAGTKVSKEMADAIAQGCADSAQATPPAAPADAGSERK